MIDVATLWIVSPEHRLLMAQRAYVKANDPGVWGPTVTGRMDPGEDIHATLLREVQEELGLNRDDFEPIFLHKSEFLDHPDGQPRTFWVYYTLLPESITNDLTLQKEEVEGVAWRTWPEIEQAMKDSPDTLVFSTVIWPTTVTMLQTARVLPNPEQQNG